MADDPYATLGVSGTASEADIRKAYRALAKELHPDLNPGNASAEDRFKKVSAAYHLLGDPERRKRFDAGEIDASGAERPEQQFYRRYADADGGGRYDSAAGFEDFADVSDIFADLFSGRSSGGRTGGGVKARGPDVRYHLDVDFLDAARGAKRRITMPDGKTLDLSIPPGISDGGTLRLKGKGAPGLGGGLAGDALVEVSVRQHTVFTREGDDIVVEVPITLDEAVLGAKVEVPTIGGRVNMTVPMGASSGDVLRLKGRGIRPKGRPPGDQRVVLKIVMPESVDPELETFMRDWRERHRYDPRQDLRRAS
ncbi:DnaJ C-terminal domain-containing protein [Oceaniradius stylonematis]|jgi:DnaJ-class molecular chaperone|uniref:DnaJ C-terminal domain-containing protein n=1 Tax=Oceaniradius stylonematis TaxID=2184161 RepID=UPI0035CE9ACB